MARAVLTLLSFQSTFATIILFLIPMVHQRSCNPNIHVDNFVDTIIPPDLLIIRIRFYLGYTGDLIPNTSIASQSPTRGIISTKNTSQSSRMVALYRSNKFNNPEC
uniref:Uncharacterized protein n=1 Tax=Rhizophagus irregularis (strain DAOM 181602 / DAOM 197198 / MUCL 43194) TaxID=747089 RepID=U9TEN8_RHIID